MRRLFGFIFQLITAAVLFIILTAVWIVVDGLNDTGDKADVALFSVRPDETLEPALEHLAKLYKDGEFPSIILCEQDEIGTGERMATATKYLEAHGVPADAIIDKTIYLNTWDMAEKVAHQMKLHECESVMLVTDYYRMTRLKIALTHEGVAEIRKSHLGEVRGEDITSIIREVIALYDYIGKTFVLPAAEKIKQEAKVGVDKVKEDAHDAKQKVDKDLNDLPK